jgi:hypothetical protein
MPRSSDEDPSNPVGPPSNLVLSCCPEALHKEAGLAALFQHSDEQMSSPPINILGLTNMVGYGA